MKEQLSTLLADVEINLAKLGFDAEPQNLYQPANYLLQIGGKRLRPILALLGCGVFSADTKKAMPQALAVEVFHNFTLMHDDIMDDAPLRRGHQTVHEKWNINTAILSGDALFAKSYQLLAQADSGVLPELLAVFTDTALQVCEGQQYDMDFENRSEVSEAEYIKMIQQKTSVLLGCALEMGALVGGAKTEDAKHLYQFGLLLGTSFQIKDDWLDCFGAPEKVGKQVGGDIIANKKTLLLIHAQNTAQGKTAEELNRWLALSLFDPEEKVTAVKAIYRELEIEKYAQQQMDLYYQQAISQLNELSEAAQNKDLLLEFARWLMNREA